MSCRKISVFALAASFVAAFGVVHPLMGADVPSNVRAVATSGSTVEVTWSSVFEASGYQIDRMDALGVWFQIGTPTDNSFEDGTVSEGKAYLYRVRAVDGGGASGNSVPDLATTVSMSDDPLAPGLVIEAIHLAELRAAVDAVRVLATLAEADTTDSAVAGTPIRAVHITELREALDEARSQLGFFTGGYTDASLTGVVVKAIHFQELRDAAGATPFESHYPPEPTMVTLSPSEATVEPYGSFDFTVTLDAPATAETAVEITVDPGNAGIVPATVTIPQEAISATFTYTDAGFVTSATVTATFGVSSSLATVTTVAAGHLVINEVDYDQIDTDTAEFIEIYNPTASPISLTNKMVVLVNGADDTSYDTIDLGPAGTLASGQYLVIAGASVTVPPAALKIDPGWTSNRIQNGSPDGIALIESSGSTATLIDALSYEGSMTSVTFTGFTGTFSLVEGTPATATDNNTTIASLCRTPDGNDTDDADTDWAVCNTITPGAANVPPS